MPTPRARSWATKGSAVDVAARAGAYRQGGWTRFDAAAPAYTHEQIEAERASHLFV